MQKSTGPRTSEGKARSAQNSFKHGLLAKPALLPDEDVEACREFMEERIRGLDPVGPLEAGLAEQIAFLLWRLNRFPRVEAGLFVGDRADRDQEYFLDRAGKYVTTHHDNPHLFLPNPYSSTQEITDQTRHAEEMKKVSAADDLKRSELALLAAAFSSAAANGDLFGKLSRYETAAFNRLRHLVADFAELQAQRKNSQSEDAEEEAPAA